MFHIIILRHVNNQLGLQNAARWTVTLSTEVPAVGITVGKTEQAGRKILLVLGSYPYQILTGTPTKIWGVFMICLVRNRKPLNFIVNETNRRTEFQFYWYYDSTCFWQLFYPSGVLSRTSALVHFCRFDERLLPGAGWNFHSLGICHDTRSYDLKIRSNLVLRIWKQTNTYLVNKFSWTSAATSFVTGGEISVKMAIWSTPLSSGISIQGTPPT